MMTAEDKNSKKDMTFVSLILGLLLYLPTNREGIEIYNPSTGSQTEKILHQDSMAAAIDSYLSAMEVLGFSGAIVVSSDDKVILKKGYGLANRETRVPYTPRTVQTSGSITKQFTAAAILLLESHNKLAVKDSITKYLDQVPKDKREITIHQLLTHSSGLTGGVGPDDEAIGASAYLDRVMKEPLNFEPGSKYRYSNAGYSLLGMIVEVVSGKSYEAFLRESLLLPTIMKDTGYTLPSWEPDQMAIGYRKGERWGEVRGRGWIDDGPNWHLRANGGLHTNVIDMHKWFGTLQGRGVLNEEMVERWITGYVSENSGYSDYGYGWVVYEHEKWGKVVSHSGSNRVFEADFVWLPEKDFFFYIQGNSNMVPAASLRGEILSAAFDPDFQIPPRIEHDASGSPETARRREGNYFLNGGKLEIKADDTRLVTKLWGQPVLDMMLGHSDQQKERFAALNKRTRMAMDRLEEGRKDALAGMVAKNVDPIETTEPFLRRIDQIGNLVALHVIGTFQNAPGSQFHESGPWTTFVYAEFENWNQYWNLIWKPDRTFIENRSGPWPTFVLVPAGGNRYKAVFEQYPWTLKNIKFEKGCLVFENQRACPQR